MSPTAEFGVAFRIVDNTPGYSPGRTATVSLTPIPGAFSIHCGISYAQNFYGYPIGAAAGVSEFTPAGGSTVVFTGPSVLPAARSRPQMRKRRTP